MNITRLFTVFAVFLALGGCATADMAGIRPYWTLHDADFRQLKPGMTQGDVEKIVGKPLSKMTFARLNEEVWGYRFLDYTIRMRSSVHFDTKGVLKYATREYDMDYYDCKGC